MHLKKNRMKKRKLKRRYPNIYIYVASELYKFKNNFPSDIFYY